MSNIVCLALARMLGELCICMHIACLYDRKRYVMKYRQVEKADRD
jgi:hypothetical protein